MTFQIQRNCQEETKTSLKRMTQIQFWKQFHEKLERHSKYRFAEDNWLLISSTSTLIGPRCCLQLDNRYL